MNELISIIIPVYKVEAYLERCVHSVVSQTYHNLEIILVDDGSPDRCGEICERLRQKDSRIRVYHKKNGGLSDARNYGMERAHGMYIAFIDSDDYIASNYIEYLVKLLIQNNADISCCCRVHTNKDNVVFGTNNSICQEQLLTGKEACQELFGDLYDILVTAWGKLYKSEIVKNYPFPSGRKYEDEAITCKYYYASNRVVVGNHCLYAYYDNPNGITHSSGETLNVDAIWALEHRAKFFEEHNEKSLAQAAWKKLFYYCLYDSIDNQGRCNHFLNTLSKRRKLSRRTQFELKLFNMSPWIFDKYLKIIIYPLGKMRDRVKYKIKGKIHGSNGVSK